jgi:Pyridoxamine 5'-phosphate oxidase
MAKRSEPKASRPVMPAGYGILEEQGGGGLLPWSWARERLERAHNYWIVTVRPGGRPHAVAVWGCWLDDKFYFSTDRATRKARNLAANPNCVVCPENAAEAISVEGIAAEVTEPATLRRFVASYNQKYSWNADITQGPFYAVAPRVVLAFIEDHEQFIGRATRWIFQSP